MEPVTHASRLEQLQLPIMWMLVIGSCLLINLDYLIGDLTTEGQHILVRCGSRNVWFASKCIWNASILVGTNGNKTILDAAYSAELYASLEKFHATEEGHLYDGLIDAYVVFSDGTILGVYSSPVQSVPDKYAPCKGLMYGVVYKVDKNSSVANFVYGFYPVEALDIPLQDIGY